MICQNVIFYHGQWNMKEFLSVLNKSNLTFQVFLILVKFQTGLVWPVGYSLLPGNSQITRLWMVYGVWRGVFIINKKNKIY